MPASATEEETSPLVIVCVLSLLSLAGLSRKSKVIYYRRLFPAWKGLVKLIPDGERRIVGLWGWFFGVKIQPIPSGTDLDNYPALHCWSEEIAADIALRNCGELLAGGALSGLARKFPELALKSFVMKNGLTSSLHHTLRGVRVLRGLHPRALKIFLQVEPNWPDSLATAVAAQLVREQVTVCRVGPVLRLMDNLMLRIIVSFSFLAIVGQFLRIHGLGLEPRIKPRYGYVTELMDPARANTGPDGNLWFVDGKSIRSESTLAFITSSQKRALGRLGVGAEEIAGGITGDGFDGVLLEELPLTFGNLWFGVWETLGIVFLRQRQTLTETIVWNRFVRNYLTYAPIFSHYTFDKYIHSLYPNGRCAPLDNSGFLTGMCERAGSMTIGYQARSLVCASHEEVFDSYHVFLSWHEGNYSGHPEGLGFIGKTESVGCYSLSGVIAPRGSDDPVSRPEEKEVLIFPSELVESGISKYTPKYSFDFIRFCADLAELHPEIRFVVKFKDPEHVDQLPSGADFDQFRKLLSKNLTIAGTQRHAYRELMDRADIVIAIGYTTPGLEALILRKPTVIYTELDTGGAFFNEFEELVATNPEDMIKLFQRVLSDPQRFWDINRKIAAKAPLGRCLTRGEQSALIAGLTEPRRLPDSEPDVPRSNS